MLSRISVVVVVVVVIAVVVIAASALELSDRLLDFHVIIRLVGIGVRLVGF